MFSRRGIWKFLFGLLVSIVLIALAATMDRTLALRVHAAGTDSFLVSHKIIREALKSPGYYWTTIAIAVLVGFLHRDRWRAAIFLLIATATSGLNELVKWIVGRTRPYKLHPGLVEPFSLNPFRNGIPGFFHQTNLSFPSGHATLAFATAAALGILWPRGRWAFYPLAAVVAAERVLENAHWLSDVVAGAALGIGGVWVVRKFLWNRFFQGVEHDERSTLPVAGDSGL